MGADGKKSTAEPPPLLGGTAIRPKDRTLGESIRYLIYDPDKGEIFTRTPKSWFLITLFYCIYYTLLACFWAGMMFIFFQFLPEGMPKYTLSDGMIGNSPGVGIRPNQTDLDIGSSIIQLDYDGWNQTRTPAPAPGKLPCESQSNVDWACRLEMFMSRYADEDENLIECDDGEAPADVASGKKACKFNAANVFKGSGCEAFPFGYLVDDAGNTTRSDWNAGRSERNKKSAKDKTEAPKSIDIEPCMMLKINRIYKWKPEEFTDEDLDEMDDMPEKIKANIRANRKKVYLECRGENPADQEVLSQDGAIQYFPADQGIDFKYFPYVHTDKEGVKYQDPLVAIKLSKKIPRDQLMHIECKLWAKGVQHDNRDRLGLVHFEYQRRSHPKDAYNYKKEE